MSSGTTWPPEQLVLDKIGYHKPEQLGFHADIVEPQDIVEPYHGKKLHQPTLLDGRATIRCAAN